MIKLFAHRGFVTKNAAQNTIASLKEAVAQNFLGIEFDIWFLNGGLFLKHDEPEFREINNLPILQDYFCFKNSLEYWMDFKNLDEKNSAKALELVKIEIEMAKIKLSKIYFAPFITDYKKAAKVFAEIRKVFGDKVQIVAVCDKLENAQEAENLRKFLAENEVKSLSIFHELIDENLIKILKGVKLFAWTVNELPRLYDLARIGVTNFATDKITPEKL